jgi:hypothetical protein
MSNKTKTVDLDSLLGGNGFDEFSETSAFATLEKSLECELSRLEDRWAHFASPCAERISLRRSFPTANPVTWSPKKPR